MNRSAIFKRTFTFKSKNFKSTTTPVDIDNIINHKDHVENLKKLFTKFNQPNFYESYSLENKSIKSLKRASVLVPISYNPSSKGYDFTLTKRNDHLRTHKGQICFVGGMKDDVDENEIVTAYREAKEEIGIDEVSLTFIAQLVPVCTTAGVLLTPVIAYLDKNTFQAKINKNEVDFMFEMSTKRFLDKTNHNSKSVGLTEKFFIHYFNDYLNDILINTWGVTAFLCICISTVINRRAPDFEIDPSSLKLNENNLSEFLENYLKFKSKSLITAYATKSKVTDTLKSLW
jgi:coenzyme A diphosphatase NUDT7